MAVPRWELATAWTLRGALLATAIVTIATERWAFGVFCIVALAAAVVPTALARTLRFTWPIEIEVVLLAIVTAHVALGYVFDLYTRVAFFDKLLHFGDSALLGFIAFLAIYVSHYLRDDRRHLYIDAVAIFLCTMGLGALWEVMEFAADQLFGTHAQGSPSMSPLADTMWDLILDGIGGVLAAVVGPLYMKHSRRSRARLNQLAGSLRSRGA